ncbi:hypothetical protein [Streptomyces sp. NPDC086010]|uniref:hypothetical protein n=1 Tax=Streptomyces sp. NPDC086010 TaxID=3365745 RepID=UPI0037D7CE6F
MGVTLVVVGFSLGDSPGEVGDAVGCPSSKDRLGFGLGGRYLLEDDTLSQPPKTWTGSVLTR